MRRRRGFTIIEVVIAIMIMSIGVIPVYFLLTTGTRGISVGYREIMAVAHGSSLAELLKGLDYKDVAQFVDDGTMVAYQTGWMVYDSSQEKLVNDDEEGETGQWEFEGGSGPKANEFFSTLLSPSAENPVLLPMEKFFKERKVTINCLETGCSIAVQMTWDTKAGNKQRTLEFRTLVTKPTI